MPNVDIATLTAKLALDAKQFNAGIETATQKIGSITKDNAWSNIGTSLNSLAKGATVAGGAIVGAAGLATKSAIDFEDAFAGVKKTVDFVGTQEEADAFFDGLETGIRKLSTKLPVTATEIAGVTEAAGQLGIQNDSLLDFTEVMLGLGSATNVTAQEAAVSLAQFANVTQMSQKDFNKLGSSIVDLGNNMATDERQVISMATELAVLRKSTGMSEADIMGLGASMASMGLDAAASGTAMQRLTMDITDAVSSFANVTQEDAALYEKISQMTAKELKDLSAATGISTKELKSASKEFMESKSHLEQFADVSGMTKEQFVKAWGEDATGAFLKFITGLGSKSTADQLKIFDTLDIKQMREVDMLQRLAGNAGLVSDAIAMSNTAWNENTALSTEVAKRNETTASQLQMVKNQLTDIAVEAGQALLPVVSQLLEQVRPLLDKVSEYLKEHPDTVVRIAEVGKNLLLIGTAVSGIIKVVTAIGSFITTIKTLGAAISVLTGGGAVAGGAGAVAGAGGIFGSLIAGLGAIAPAVLAVGAVMGAFAIAWKNDWLHCQEHMSEAVETFKKKKEEGASTLEAFGEAARVFARGLASEISGWWNNTVVPWLANVWNHISNWFSNAFAGISAWFGNTWNWIKGKTSELWNHMTQWLSNIWSTVTEKISSIRNTVVEKMTSIWSAITEKMSSIKNTVSEKVTSTWADAKAKITSIPGEVRGIFEQVRAAIADKMSAVSGAVSSAVEGMKSKIRSIIDAIGDAWDRVKDFASNAWDNAKSWVGNTFGGYFASGGPVSAGQMVMTGEEGPELFVPRTDGYILNHEDTMDYLGGHEVNIYIQGDVYDDQYSMQKKLKGAMLEVLREQVAYG